MSSKAPFVHLDGSPCWTPKCRRGNLLPQNFHSTIQSQISKWWTANMQLTRTGRKEEPEIQGNEKMALVIAQYMSVPTPKQPSILMRKLSKFAAQEGYKIDLEVWSPQALASQMGIVLELSIKEFIFNKYKNHPNIVYVRGDELGKEIDNVRRNGTPEQIQGCRDYLIKTIHFSPSFADSILVKPEKGIKNPINLPDSIVINSADPNNVVIKVGEMKASGENDSSAVPANIRKLVANTPKSAVNAWVNNPDVHLEKSILITASATTTQGSFTHESRWVRELADMNISDISVKCNSNAYNWLSGEALSETEYEKTIVDTTVNAQFKRLLRSGTGIGKISN